MPSFKDAISQTADGIEIAVEVIPGSRMQKFPTGYNAWRNTIGISVTAPPAGGRANAMVISLVADVLGIPRSMVRIVSGHQARRKTIGITGTDLDDVLPLLGFAPDNSDIT
ncbi:MAG: DUF167 domain-containing protein [Methanocalculus sp. MSAO_Arc1]|uniref:DUF167 domain-containing protein n=1 Tax=Methanocalculus TaxID=71151 RepID=UPI000FF7D363|nr:MULTISPECIES: DUF167 domain-containing protein [unclassified Methanocalculus]MCP1662839.1 uncharacterized protein (TIGR00251 family) [Methanocalculus sp. AMF5]RQD78998.1 MAG: DUF167 domain-containing protein [Methanocalculus sp. MSAO_Arc1]